MAVPIVTFLVSRFPNPSETFIQAQAEGLLERGMEVDIVAMARGDCRELLAKWGGRLRVHNVRLGKSLLSRLPGAIEAGFRQTSRAAFNPFRFGYDGLSWRLPVAAAHWPKLAEGNRVWLAHYGRWGSFACNMRTLGLLSGPVATVFHGKDMSAYVRRRPKAYRKLFQQGELFMPISETWRRKLVDLGAAPSRILMHRMGVDVRRFVERPRTLAPGEPVRFIAVGRLVEKKGFDDAIAAFAQYRLEKKAPPAQLTIIGAGALRKVLEKQVAEAGLDNLVTFTGGLPHEQVAEMLNASHVFILPSKTARDGDQEGIPVALMEAMAQGMPVLTTRHSGIPELVGHNVSGLLCEEKDRAGLAANMVALARWPERWGAMGAAGARRVREEFDLSAWNDKLATRLAALAPNR